MLTSVDKMFIRFIFAKDMQLHYIWYYKILIKNSSCYPCGQFLISLCFPLQIRVAILYFYLFFFFLKNWCSWEPTFDRDMINMATCWEGLAMEIPPCGCPLFSWLLLHVAAVSRSSCGGSEPAAGAAEPAVLPEESDGVEACYKYTSRGWKFYGGSSDGHIIRDPSGSVGSKLICQGEM